MPPRIVLSLTTIVVASLAAADPSPSELAVLFRKERDAAVVGGAERVVPAYPLERADTFARRADDAMQGGRADIATRLFRDARWALPAVPVDAPPRVDRLLGDPRFRHGGPVTSVAFSPDGGLLLSAWSRRTGDGAGPGSIRVWDLGTGRLLRDYRGHSERSAVVAFLDGRRVASAGGKDIRVWDAQTGRDEQVLTGSSGAIHALAVEPGGRRLVAAGDDRVIRVWDVAEAREAFNLGVLGNQRVTGAAWSRDGRLIAAVNAAGTLAVWDVAGTAHKRIFELPAVTAAEGVAFAPDSRNVAVCGDRVARLYALPAADAGGAETAVNLRRSFEGPGGHTNRVVAVAFSPDGRTLATAAHDNSVRLWDVATGQVQRTLPGHAEEVAAVAFSPDGGRLASGGYDQALRLWDLQPVTPVATFASHRGPVWSVCWLPDGRLASAGADRSVRVWRLGAQQPDRTMSGHTQPVTALATAGTALLSTGGDGQVKTWDSAGEAEPRTVTSTSAALLAIAVTPDGQTAVVGGADRVGRIINLAGGAVAVTGPKHQAAVTAVARQPGGDQAASASADGVVKLWSSADGVERVSFRAHDSGGVSALGFTPDGRRLITAGGDRTIKVWRVAPGFSKEPIAVLSGHSGPVSALALNADGSWLASGGADAVVKVWDLATRAEVRAFRGHGDWVSTVAFGPDGTTLASAGVDGNLLVWRLERESSAAIQAGHTRTVTAVTAGAGRIVTGGRDRQLIVWDETTARPLRALAGHGATILAVALAPDRSRIISSADDRKIRWWEAETGRELRSFDPPDGGKAPTLVSQPDGKGFLAWVLREGSEDDATSTIRRFTDAGGPGEVLVSETGKPSRCLAFSPDAALAVAATPDGSARVWKLDGAKSEKVVEDFAAHSSAVADVAVSASRGQFVTAALNGEVKTWALKLKPGEPVATAHLGWEVAGVAMQPAGDRFAVFGAEGEVAVFNTGGTKPVKAWTLAQRVRGVAFSADGGRLVTANEDGTAYVLRLAD